MSYSPDAIAEALLIELSRMQREAMAYDFAALELSFNFPVTVKESDNV